MRSISDLRSWEIPRHNPPVLFDRFGSAYARGVTYISEGSVVIVVVELNVLPIVVARMAVRMIARPMLAAPDVGFRRSLNVIGNYQFERPIFIIVKPSCPG